MLTNSGRNFRRRFSDRVPLPPPPSLSLFLSLSHCAGTTRWVKSRARAGPLYFPGPRIKDRVRRLSYARGTFLYASDVPTEINDADFKGRNSMQIAFSRTRVRARAYVAFLPRIVLIKKRGTPVMKNPSLVDRTGGSHIAIRYCSTVTQAARILTTSRYAFALE